RSCQTFFSGTRAPSFCGASWADTFSAYKNPPFEVLSLARTHYTLHPAPMSTPFLQGFMRAAENFFRLFFKKLSSGGQQMADLRGIVRGTTKCCAFPHPKPM